MIGPSQRTKERGNRYENQAQFRSGGVDTICEGLKRTSGYCPCRVERTEKNAGTLKVGRINVDEQMELAMRFQVSSIPMLVVFKDGKAVAKSVGYRSKAEITAMVEGAR